MRNEIPPESRLWAIANAMGIFQGDATARRPDRDPGEAKNFFVEEPFAPGAPNISIRFPGDLLNRVDRLDAHEKEVCVQNIANVVLGLRGEYDRAIADGRISIAQAFVVELDPAIFDGVRERA